MGWVEDLHGQTVGVDTAPFVYFIEEHSTYLAALREFFEAVDEGNIQAVTSTVSLLEVLVHPYRRGEHQLAAQYRAILLNSNGLSCEVVSVEIAEDAARLRADYNFQTPDSIQLTTAIRAGASSFLTNDSYLRSIPSIQILILDQLVHRN